MEYLFLVLLGASSGLVAGLAGLGGGTVIVPVLTWLYGKGALQQAIVVSWWCVLFNSAGAFAAQLRVRSGSDRADYLQASKSFLAGVLLATPAAAIFLSTMKGAVSPAVVGGLQLTLAAVMLWPRVEAAQPRRISGLLDAGAGALIGGASALIGIGGGAYTTAYMVWGPRRPLRDAIAAGNATGLVVGAMSVAGFVFSMLWATRAAGGDVPVISAAGMAVLVLSGTMASTAGVHLSRGMSTRALKRFLVAFLAMSALHLLLS